MKDDVSKKLAQALEGASLFENGNNIPDYRRWKIVPTMDIALETIRYICERSGNVSQFFPYGNNRCPPMHRNTNSFATILFNRW
jgi:hypothetical protein